MNVETCRSLVKSENEILVSEWRRKNGRIDPTHSCPMNVPIELPKESALMTDSAMILAEKILTRLGLIGKYAKLMTLDKRALCAPITLRVTKEKDKNLFKVIKSSPVDKGTTESFYNENDAKLLTRSILTSQDKKYNLKVSLKSQLICPYVSQCLTNVII